MTLDLMDRDGEGLFSIKVDTAEQASILKDLLNVTGEYKPGTHHYLLVDGAFQTFNRYLHTKAVIDFDEAVEEV